MHNVFTIIFMFGDVQLLFQFAEYVNILCTNLNSPIPSSPYHTFLFSLSVLTYFQQIESERSSMNHELESSKIENSSVQCDIPHPSTLEDTIEFQSDPLSECSDDLNIDDPDSIDFSSSSLIPPLSFFKLIILSSLQFAIQFMCKQICGLVFVFRKFFSFICYMYIFHISYIHMHTNQM